MKMSFGKFMVEYGSFFLEQIQRFFPTEGIMRNDLNESCFVHFGDISYNGLKMEKSLLLP